jgi:hypothetical protein
MVPSPPKQGAAGPWGRAWRRRINQPVSSGRQPTPRILHGSAAALLADTWQELDFRPLLARGGVSVPPGAAGIDPVPGCHQTLHVGMAVPAHPRCPGVPEGVKVYPGQPVLGNVSPLALGGSFRRRQATGGQLGAQQRCLKPTALVEAKHAPLTTWRPMRCKNRNQVRAQIKLARQEVFRRANAGTAFSELHVIPAQCQRFAKPCASVEQEGEQQG